MAEAEGRFAKQIGGRGSFASVRVAYSLAGDGVQLAPRADNDWHRSQGWLDAAVAGCALGLALAGKCGGCTVAEVGEDVCPGGTTRAAVMVAAIRAVWAATGFEPDERLAERLAGCEPGLTIAEVGQRLGCDDDWQADT
jgi:hypothetical protein